MMYSIVKVRSKVSEKQIETVEMKKKKSRKVKYVEVFSPSEELLCTNSFFLLFIAETTLWLPPSAKPLCSILCSLPKLRHLCGSCFPLSCYVVFSLSSPRLRQLCGSCLQCAAFTLFCRDLNVKQT